MLSSGMGFLGAFSLVVIGSAKETLLSFFPFLFFLIFHTLVVLPSYLPLRGVDSPLLRQWLELMQSSAPPLQRGLLAQADRLRWRQLPWRRPPS